MAEGIGGAPPDMLASVLDNSPDLSVRIKEMVGPVRDERDAIRAALLAETDLNAARIVPLPTETGYAAVGATDGACVVTPLALGDHMSTLAVGVRSAADGDVTVTGHRAWSDFWGHQSHPDTVAKAVMMAGELSLLSTFPDDTVVVIDGSHVTPLVAINLALASNEPEVRQLILDLEPEGLVDWVRYAVDTPSVVACPKSDSSTDLWLHFRRAHPRLGERGLPDKVLAGMLLEPGEMLVSRRDAAISSWRFLLDFNKAADAEAVALAEKLKQAALPLRQMPSGAESYIQVFHAKPDGASTAFRIEVKASADFDTYDMIAAVGNDCASPWLQEPVAQYLADGVAKSVATVANFQMERARFDLAETDGADYLLDYLLRHYRTT